MENRFPASKAAEYGLISPARYPRMKLDAAIDEVRRQICERVDLNALGVAKRLIYEVPRMEPAGRHGMGKQKLSAECFASDEAREGNACVYREARRRMESTLGVGRHYSTLLALHGLKYRLNEFRGAIR